MREVVIFFHSRHSGFTLHGSISFQVSLSPQIETAKEGAKNMFKRVVSAVTAAVILVFNMSGRPVAPSGSWQVDARHSDARLSTDGTTDFGKTKMNLRVGFTRVNGTVTLDQAALADSRFDFRMYPAGSMPPHRLRREVQDRVVRKLCQ